MSRCQTEERFQPRIVEGWLWLGSGKRIPSTNSTPAGWSASPWGSTGAITAVITIFMKCSETKNNVTLYLFFI